MASPKPRKQTKPTNSDAPLTDKQLRFVSEFAIDLNGKQAAIRAGYSPATADSQASRLLTNAKVQQAVRDAQKRASETANITAAMVLRRWWDLACVDPNELTQHRRIGCRHCRGIDSLWQWVDETEYSQALKLAMLDAGDDPILNASLPSDDGGFGYDQTKDPVDHCPRCHGEGVPRIFIADTRKLSPAARTLFAGVKTTKDGVEIKMHDQAAALERVARHLAMFNDKLTLAGDAENPLVMLLAQVQGSAIKPKALT